MFSRSKPDMFPSAEQFCISSPTESRRLGGAYRIKGLKLHDQKK